MNSLVAQTVKHLPTMQETRVQPLDREYLLEKEMTNYSRIIAWKTPWMEEPGKLQSMGSQRVRHDFTFTFTSVFLGARIHNNPNVVLGFPKSGIFSDTNSLVVGGTQI